MRGVGGGHAGARGTSSCVERRAELTPGTRLGTTAPRPSSRRPAGMPAELRPHGRSSFVLQSVLQTAAAGAEVAAPRARAAREHASLTHLTLREDRRTSTREKTDNGPGPPVELDLGKLDSQVPTRRFSLALRREEGRRGSALWEDPHGSMESGLGRGRTQAGWGKGRGWVCELREVRGLGSFGQRLREKML